MKKVKKTLPEDRLSKSAKTAAKMSALGQPTTRVTYPAKRTPRKGKGK